MAEYDPIRDYWESHWLAIRIKRERGDDYFVKPKQPLPLSDQEGRDAA